MNISELKYKIQIFGLVGLILCMCKIITQKGKIIIKNRNHFSKV